MIIFIGLPILLLVIFAFWSHSRHKEKLENWRQRNISHAIRGEPDESKPGSPHRGLLLVFLLVALFLILLNGGPVVQH
jgi:hypothetical protein